MDVKNAFERIAAVKPEAVEVSVNGETATVYLREPALADKIAITTLVLERDQIPVDHDGEPLMFQISGAQLGSLMELKFRALQRVLSDESGALLYDTYEAMAGTLRQDTIAPLADQAWLKYGMTGEEQQDASGN